MAAEVKQDDEQVEVVEDGKESTADGDAVNQGAITEKYASLKPYLNYNTWKALTGKPFNFEDMSVVQQRVLGLLPHLASSSEHVEMPDGQGRDMLVKAKTGTGKTIAFLVPALERRLRAIEQARKLQFTRQWSRMLTERKPDLNLEGLDKHEKERLARQFCINTAGVLVISPTRELATQIANEAQKLCTHHKELNIHLFVGGASRVQQLRKLSKERPDIIVGTPGRIIDLLNEEKLVSGPMSALQTLIYDEADTLLDMGFRDDIEKIVSKVSKAEDRMTMLFSATVSKEVREIARKSLLPDHRFIDCVPQGEDNVHLNVPQHYTVLPDANAQFAHLLRTIALDQIKNAGKSKVIVFCPTRSVTKLYHARLHDKVNGLSENLPAGSKTRCYELHSNIDSSRRFRISDQFRGDKTGASVLFTSDVSARGVDYPGTTQVIQIGIPSSPDIYVHRVGRTGRAGASGRADLLLQPFEHFFVTSQLNHLPVKEISPEAMQEELESLARKYDEDKSQVVSEKYLKELAKSSAGGVQKRTDRYGSSSSSSITYIRGNLTEKLCDGALEEASKKAAKDCDKEEIEETFMSMLGYYASRSRELRAPISKICEELKTWAVSAGDLDRPPFVSNTFLERLGSGFKESTRRSTSRQPPRGLPTSDRRDQPRSWEGRGGSRRGERSFQGGERSFDRRSPTMTRSASRGRDERFF